MCEPYLSPKTCCECLNEFKPTAISGYRTATRPKYKPPHDDEKERYIVGDLCENCIGIKEPQPHTPQSGQSARKEYIMNEINIYAKGLLCISVCAPIDMPSDEVETLVNVEYPCGTENGWSLSKDEYFSDGKTLNGAEVDCSNGKTRHWLFDA